MKPDSTLPRLDDWESMEPVGREFGSPIAETFEKLDTVAERLAGSELVLSEDWPYWVLSWCGHEICRWQTEETDFARIRAVLQDVPDFNALAAWDMAVGGK